MVGDGVTRREVADREHRTVIAANGCSRRHADALRSGPCFEYQDVRGEVDGRDQSHSDMNLAVDYGSGGKHERQCRARREEQAGERWQWVVQRKSAQAS